MHMPHQDEPGRHETKAITVRLDVDEYERLKSYAERHGSSLNTVVREAVAAYGMKINRLDVLEEIRRFHDELTAAGKCSPDEAVEIIRDIRLQRSGYRGQEKQ